MYALFLETKAAQQIERYAADKGVDAEKIKQKCYVNAQSYQLEGNEDKSQQAWDGWWVTRCLDGDSHKEYDVDQLMLWEDTPEGDDFWCNISNY